MALSATLRVLTVSLLLTGALSSSCFSPTKNKVFAHGSLWLEEGTLCHVSRCFYGVIRSRVHQPDVPWTGPGCERFVCSKTGGVSRLRCPPFVAPPNCITVVEQPDGEYPSCCPKPQCF
ncbi:hypothetical protein FJT64_027485 [Amphibalanus amphitrite]|uniref:Single domain-containing protein n=1 Tax=Amphibalanus amphitrite TaxID=1232801 RepID=A0A6A4W3M4_AMPAM|nr:hypothetical protein FJT64_027485 [Amphibalanus amphitrite]